MKILTHRDVRVAHDSLTTHHPRHPLGLSLQNLSAHTGNDAHDSHDSLHHDRHSQGHAYHPWNWASARRHHNHTWKIHHRNNHPAGDVADDATVDNLDQTFSV